MKNLEVPSALVSATWLHDHLSHPQLCVLDSTIKKVNNPSSAGEAPIEWIPGSRFFDLKHRFADTTNAIPNMLTSPQHFEMEARNLGINANSCIVIYDRLGVYASPRVWWMFRTMGHKNVAVLDGGMPAWNQARLPTEPVQNKGIEKGNFTSSFQKSLVRNAEQVLAKITNRSCATLDARSEGRFYGREPEPREGLRGGHIPGSMSLPYTKLLEDGKFKSKEELKALFQQFELADKQLQFSCGSGITACILALGAKLCGYTDYSVYDGSWSEWGLPGDLPVSTV